MSELALIVIDMQNDFCDPSASLFVAGAPAIVRHVSLMMRTFRALGAPVIVVMRRHRSWWTGRRFHAASVIRAGSVLGRWPRR